MQAVEAKIAVCSWLLQPQSIEELISKTRECGLNKVQLALEPLVDRSPQWLYAASKLRDAEIEIVSGMMGYVGEDYSTISKIKETGGVMPDSIWLATLKKMRAAAPLAKQLGMKLVTFHAGFIPHDPSCWR